MTTAQWKLFFEVATDLLGVGNSSMSASQTWCSWSTFQRLSNSDAGYWTSGLPNRDEIGIDHIKDGGTWGQPFAFCDLAHVIVPGRFVDESGEAKVQDIEKLEAALLQAGVPCSRSFGVLEVKEY